MLPTIKYRSSGEPVEVAQILTGFSVRDGVYSKEFKTFVQSFQLKHSLDTDGIIGPKTWAAIAGITPTVSLKKNTTHAAVRALQLLLDVEPVSGAFDEITKAAVTAFQTTAKLSVDAIVGPKTWSALILGIEETAEIKNPCVHYLQWDKRWKNVMYSSHADPKQTIGSSGCGPTSMAMIVATMIDNKITPVETCALSIKGGYRTYDSGTAWGYFKYAFDHYKDFSYFVKTSSLATVKAALKKGALVVGSMNSNDGGFWTKGGHFITILGCDGKYIYANDPNKSSHPRKQLESKFKSCMKQAFIFYGPEEENK
ncbi:MAG: peptidoglycan-binding protein [Clostridia bacterium]|nr:peptidoglycan-binding protein [Clostridia bacterium]